VSTVTELTSVVRDLAAEVVASGARRVLLVPPDQTRLHSRAGDIVAQLVGLLDDELDRVDVMPALGTHQPLGPAEAQLMFGDAIAASRLLHHRWREDVTTIGELSAEEVDEIIGRPMGLALPFAVNRVLVDDSYDLVVSVGQIVPHEVAGYGGYTKHITIGLGGNETIQRSHFLSAVYGIEQTMGRADAPVRQLLDLGFDRFFEQRCRVLFALTVVEATDDGPTLRGVFTGEGGTRSAGGDAFRAAVALSAEVNIETVATPFRRCVAYLDPEEYRSTWLANKAIYRTRLAMADGGELIVIAPGVERFGEDPLVDTLIRRHGYRGRETSLEAMTADPELAANLAAVAHLMHGSTDGRFTVTYAPGPELSRADIEGVGFDYLPLDEAPLDESDIPNPGLGLWRI
jgi:nickel-dependent lactate racemase